MAATRQRGRASGVVAVPGTEVIHQGRAGGKGIGGEAGHRAGAVCELAGPEEGEPLVVVLGLVFPVHEGRQVRQDQAFSLAAQCVGQGVQLVRVPVHQRFPEGVPPAIVVRPVEHVPQPGSVRIGHPVEPIVQERQKGRADG